MDPQAHKRFLDYRERHTYFGGSTKVLTMEEFVAAEIELAELEKKGERRDDDEEVRHADLLHVLLRD